MNILGIILIAREVAALLRDCGLTYEDVGHIVAKAQAEDREVTMEDVHTYVKKRKDALADLDKAVEEAKEST